MLDAATKRARSSAFSRRRRKKIEYYADLWENHSSRGWWRGNNAYRLNSRSWRMVKTTRNISLGQALMFFLFFSTLRTFLDRHLHFTGIEQARTWSNWSVKSRNFLPVSVRAARKTTSRTTVTRATRPTPDTASLFNSLGSNLDGPYPPRSVYFRVSVDHRFTWMTF